MFRDGVIYRGFQNFFFGLLQAGACSRSHWDTRGSQWIFFRTLFWLPSGTDFSLCLFSFDSQTEVCATGVYRGVLFPANSLALEICAVIVFNSSEPAGKSLSNFCHCSIAF